MHLAVLVQRNHINLLEKNWEHLKQLCKIWLQKYSLISWQTILFRLVPFICITTTYTAWSKPEVVKLYGWGGIWGYWSHPVQLTKENNIFDTIPIIMTFPIFYNWFCCLNWTINSRHSWTLVQIFLLWITSMIHIYRTLPSVVEMNTCSVDPGILFGHLQGTSLPCLLTSLALSLCSVY